MSQQLFLNFQIPLFFSPGFPYPPLIYLIPIIIPPYYLSIVLPVLYSIEFLQHPCIYSSGTTCCYLIDHHYPNSICHYTAPSMNFPVLLFSFLVSMYSISTSFYNFVFPFSDSPYLCDCSIHLFVLIYHPLCFPSM